eukprot:356274-Chlamydomonas_euryale.AAC.7
MLKEVLFEQAMTCAFGATDVTSMRGLRRWLAAPRTAFKTPRRSFFFSTSEMAFFMARTPYRCRNSAGVAGKDCWP